MQNILLYKWTTPIYTMPSIRRYLAEKNTTIKQLLTNTWFTAFADLKAFINSNRTLRHLHPKKEIKAVIHI